MNINLLGIDIAKNIFQLHGVDSKGMASPRFSRHFRASHGTAFQM